MQRKIDIAVRSIMGSLLLFSLYNVNADPCSDAFPASIQSHTVSGSVAFSCGTQIVNALSATLPTGTVVNPNACPTKTCETEDCHASGAVAPTLEAGVFQSSTQAGGSVTVAVGENKTLDSNVNQISDYDTVIVNATGYLSFSPNVILPKTTYRIQSLTLDNASVLHLPSGNYWIENLTVLGDSIITVDASNGTARLFVQNFTHSGTGKLLWNQTGSAADLLIYAYSTLTLGGVDSLIKGIVYSKGNVVLKQNCNVFGAVNAENVTLNGTSLVNYDPSAAGNTRFGFMCPSSQVAYYEVSAPETITRCQKTTVTVTARNEVDQVVSDYTGQILLSTTANSSGTWDATLSNGTFIANDPQGTATYEYDTSDYGVARFEFTYPTIDSGTLVFNAHSVSSSVVSGLSSPSDFSSSGFIVTEQMIPPNSETSVSSFSSPQIAGTEFTMYITALKKNSCKIDKKFKKKKDIRFWSDYVNPISGSVAPLVNGSPVAISESAAETVQEINFVNGVAQVTTRYDDAGKLALNVEDLDGSDDGHGHDHDDSGRSGTSGHFVIRPADFVLSVLDNNAAQTISPPSAAVAACINNSVFKKAGEPFTVSVQPRNALGGVTPNYGNEIISEGISLRSGNLLAPSAGRNGSANQGIIGNQAGFFKITSDPGPFSEAPYFSGSNFSFDEVGCIELLANVATGSYLGAGEVSGTVVVGRFTPDHFNATKNSPAFDAACSASQGGFTYLDQPFLYSIAPVVQVAAYARGGSTTQNYTGDFWRLGVVNLGAVYNKTFYPTNPTDNIPDLAMNFSLPNFIDNGNGTGEFHFVEGSGFKIERLEDQEIPPFTAEIQLQISTITDSDGVTCTGNGCQSGGVDFGETSIGNGIPFLGLVSGNTFYHGRLVMHDAAGSELLVGSVPMRIEYYTSDHGFILNEQDNCTIFNGSVDNLILTPSAGLVTSASLLTPFNFQEGVLTLTLAVPNTPGYVDIQASLGITSANLPWLQYNWPYENISATDFSLDPKARYTFGLFDESDPIIYKKERTN